MSGEFDKFVWIRAVGSDSRIPSGRRFVLVCIAIENVLRNGDNTFCVRQATIAEKFRVPEWTVKRAMADARRLGYLKLAQQRRRGRGHHGADRYLLNLPVDKTEIGSNASPIPEEIGSKNNGNREQCVPEIGSNANASTSENDTPKGSLQGSREGSGADDCVDASTPAFEPDQPGDAPTPNPSANSQKPAAKPDPALVAEPPVIGAPGKRELEPDPEPPRFCDRHPDGTDESCRACGDARKTHEAWEARRFVRRRTLAEVEAADIARCTECDEYGWLYHASAHRDAEHGWHLTQTGVPAEPASRCPHAALWCAYWQPVLDAVG